ncbi:carbonic anhydrase [Xylaria arbuscula]|nr:carbonic anhydrase [Xylaria arbuscula]
MASPFVSEMLQRAKVSSQNHTPFPDLVELNRSPIKGKMIFCCFDRRVKPEKFLGLTEQDRVFLVRTASGTPERNITDIVAIDTIAGLSEVVVIKHTDCGATHITDDTVRRHIVKHNPDLAGKVDDFTATAFTDIVQRTKQDVDIIKSSPLIRKELRDTVSGLLYDIKTGELTRIV